MPGAKGFDGGDLKGKTPAEAPETIRALLVERSKSRLRHIGRCLKFGDSLQQIYFPKAARLTLRPV